MSTGASLLPPGHRRLIAQIKTDNGAALKQIAGLIQKLSFRDMKAFAEALEAQNLNNIDTAEALLAAADKLLED